MRELNQVRRESGGKRIAMGRTDERSSTSTAPAAACSPSVWRAVQAAVTSPVSAAAAVIQSAAPRRQLSG